MRAEKVVMPAFLASALVNGDTEGLTREDLALLRDAIAYVAPGRVVSTEGEAYFSWWNELTARRMGCEVMEYVVLYEEEK